MKVCQIDFGRHTPTVVLAPILRALSGCVHLDKLSAKAAEFNVEVAEAQNKTMLHNIVRAAHRYPMHLPGSPD
jgi:hypothetical protein